MTIVIITKPKRKKPIPQMQVPPTPERAKQGFGIRESHHRFAAIEPFEWLYERNIYGRKDGTQANDRLRAAKYFLFLYILNEERPNYYAMLDWEKYILGLGSSSGFVNDKEAHQSWMLEKRKEYEDLCKKIKKASYGSFGFLVLRKICKEGAFLGQIEKQFHWPQGMAAVIIRKTLDDIKDIVKL